MSTETVFTTAKSAIQTALGTTNAAERETAMETAAAAVDEMRRKLELEQIQREEKANGAGYQLRADKVLQLVKMGFIGKYTSPDMVEALFAPFAFDSMMETIFKSMDLPGKLDETARLRFQSLFQTARDLASAISGLRLLAETLRGADASDAAAAARVLHCADDEIESWNSRLGDYLI